MFCVVYSCSYRSNCEKEKRFSEFKRLLLLSKVRRAKSSQNNAVKSRFQPSVCGREEPSLLMPVSAAVASSDQRCVSDCNWHNNTDSPQHKLILHSPIRATFVHLHNHVAETQQLKRSSSSPTFLRSQTTTAMWGKKQNVSRHLSAVTGANRPGPREPSIRTEMNHASFPPGCIVS